MNNTRARSVVGWFRPAFISLLLASAPVFAINPIDQNSDGVGDIYAMKYNAAGLAAAGDADQDGKTNWEEMIAGTNPWQGASELAVSAVTIDGEGVHLSWISVAGKQYLVQSKTDLAQVNWQDEVPVTPISGNGEMIARTYPVGAEAKYYRVLVQDKDTDHDGVSDWEEITVGFNPNSAQSSGGATVNDFTAITAALGATGNVVSITASDAAAVEPSSGSAFDTGTFVITRNGNLNPLTVNYTFAGTAGSGTDYATLSGSVTLPMFVNSSTITVAPLADSAVESPETVTVTVGAGAGYTPGGTTAATVLINDFMTPNGTGLRARYWNNINTSVPMFANGATGSTNFTPVLDRVESLINFSYPDPTTPGAGVNSDYYTARFSGEILPEFSQIYTFTSIYDRGSRLFVNGVQVFSNFTNGAAAGTSSGLVELEANKRVPIVYEYMARSGVANAVLRWASTNRPDEIVPQSRLFPNTPPQILSTLEVLLIKNSPAYTYQIVASGEPTGFSASGLPPGWTVHPTTGLISGTPNTAGDFAVALTASNAAGSGTAILDLRVIETGGAITRDVWAGLAGTAVTAVPVTQPTTSAISSLDVPQSAPNQDDYYTRIRGYITAPFTGVYKFWLTGSDSAELYIADDEEVVNSFRRAAVTAPTGYREWTSVNARQSPLLQLYAAKRYYVEIRHKAGVGASDYLSVGWLKPGDPGSAAPASVTTPNEVVPSYALSPWVAPAPVDGETTLYTTSMTAQGGAVTSGYGSASLRLSADETTATFRYDYAALTSPVVAKHIHSDAHAGAIIFDIDTATKNQDGTYTWNLESVGAISTADILNTIKTGQAYVNVHTANYLQGEIRGNLRFQAASQTFTPPSPQTWTDPENAANPDSHLNRNAASRFLVQATFGPNAAEIASVQALGFEGWIDAQIAKPITQLYPYVFANRALTDSDATTYPGDLVFNSWWRASVTGQDQLRQRVAFALNEVMVVSEDGPLEDRADTVSDYYDMLLANSFDNVRKLLEDVTLHPAMGRYLDMLNNRKPNLSTGRIPNENYAREIKQLFAIGLYRMHPDGSLVLNSKGEIIPTYDQNAIIGFAHVFTGWGYNYTGAVRTTFTGTADWINPMREVPLEHFTGQKQMLNSVVLPGLTTVAGAALNPYGTPSGAQLADPVFQALPGVELDFSHDQLFQHPNIGPFLCRQLIQRLVTATPSRGYLYRVVQKFNDNGSGVRGDMVAIIKAILLDHEARSATLLNQQGYGKQREPIVRVTGIARGFPVPTLTGGTYTQANGLIQIETPTAHLYSGGNTLYLEFAPSTSGDAGAPTNATYTVLTSPAPTTTAPHRFWVRTKSSEAATYVARGASTTFTETGGNGFLLSVGTNIFAEFLDGTSAPANRAAAVEFITGAESEIAVIGAPGAKRGTYAQTAASGANITITTTAHGFTEGTSLHVDFLSSSAALPVSGVYTVLGAPNAPTANAYTITVADTVARTGTAIAVLAANAQTVATGNAQITRAADSATRSGPLTVTYSDWAMGSTDTDLNQTPLNSPTVFNYFLPDYQYPGILANAGLITPEFQITSETSVIRQANFLYNGIFNDAFNQRGLASFRSGGRDIMVDLRPWLGSPPPGTPGADSTKPWVHDDNLNALIDELNTRLMGGQLPSTGVNNYGNPRVIVNAKQSIRDYVATLGYLRTVSNTAATVMTNVTVTGHGLTTGASVTIAGVTGTGVAPAINATFTATVTGPNTFTVPVTCTNASPGLTTATANGMPITALGGFTTVTTSANHLLAAGQSVTITGVTGGTFSPSINGTFTIATVPASTTFTVPVTRVSSTSVNYTNARASTPAGYPDLNLDRIRSVVHLLVTSPDFTVQK